MIHRRWTVSPAVGLVYPCSNAVQKDSDHGGVIRQNPLVGACVSAVDNKWSLFELAEHCLVTDELSAVSDILVAYTNRRIDRLRLAYLEATLHSVPITIAV